MSMQKKYPVRVGFTMTQVEKDALGKIAKQRQTSEASVVRWLIWREHRRREAIREARVCTA